MEAVGASVMRREGRDSARRRQGVGLGGGRREHICGVTGSSPGGAPIVQREGEELGGRVVPVLLVPRDVLGGEELRAPEERVRDAELDEGGVESEEPVALRLEGVPVEARHVVVVAVPVVVPVPRLRVLVACTRARSQRAQLPSSSSRLPSCQGTGIASAGTARAGGPLGGMWALCKRPPTEGSSALGVCPHGAAVSRAAR